MVIPNTLEVKTLWVSPALQAEVDAHPHLPYESDFFLIPFSPAAWLDQEGLFPESVRVPRVTGASAGH